jgi:hypothetical protein
MNARADPSFEGPESLCNFGGSSSRKRIQNYENTVRHKSE